MKRLLRPLVPSFLLEKRRRLATAKTAREELDLQRIFRNQDVSISVRGDSSHSESLALSRALLGALQSDATGLDEILAMEGMSGRKFRQLINKVIAATPNASYLEIGSWIGSTACSAMHGNRVRITCVDNWSQFGGPKEELFKNIGASKN